MKQTSDFEKRVTKLIQASIEVKQKLLHDNVLVSMVAEASRIIVAALGQGNKILICGNGGSAADAQHIAAEFVGRFAFDRPALPALALSVNTSCVTAIGNDYGFDLVFSRQIEALGKKGDVVIGISTSGDSANVLRAMSTSKKLGLRRIALTGCTGGKLKYEVESCLCVPSNETPRIQECHILIGHIISELVEQTIFLEYSGIPDRDRIGPSIPIS
ncbi:D-sedoheptulose 7-phosphate isomerase [Tunturibacter psychrotolerans]|uniref:Phosphoheptose isomerase n=1 Tax=Tunturiibacter psychrotolerans TaxID=3069686 RepID=A0AAU7ZNE3_9BACT